MWNFKKKKKIWLYLQKLRHIFFHCVIQSPKLKVHLFRRTQMKLICSAASCYHKLTVVKKSFLKMSLILNTILLEMHFFLQMCVFASRKVYVYEDKQYINVFIQLKKYEKFVLYCKININRWQFQEMRQWLTTEKEEICYWIRC